MACFIAPAAEAVIVSAVRHSHEKHETNPSCSDQIQEHNSSAVPSSAHTSGHSFSGYLMSRLHILSSLLWGGSFLLLIEHIWHGEIVPWFPFFTAVKTPGGIGPMLYEIATVGTSMALVVTAAWLIGSAFCYEQDKKHAFLSETAKEV